MTIRRNPMLRGLAVSFLGLVLAAPAAMAADPVTLTLYNGQHKEIGDAIAKAYEAKTGIHIKIRKGMTFALPIALWASLWLCRAAPPLSRNDWGLLLVLGVLGYYGASILDCN